MILISSQEDDFSTYEVMRYFKYLKVPFCRINQEDIIEISEINLETDNICIKINNQAFSFKEINSFWYRRGYFNINNNKEDKTLAIESAAINSYIFDYLNKKTYNINSYNNSKVNKLTVLNIARQHGLKIPYTIISGRKEVVDVFLTKKSDVITKTIAVQLNFKKDGFLYIGYTELLDKKVMESFGGSFFPSLLQTNIQKRYEVRSFLLENEFYSMAIFSQSNPKTNIDFRKYDSEKPNRCVPYKLPSEIQIKLRNIFEELDLNSGSADLIVDINNNFYFLEINPVGQFGMVSKPCNYHLERQIADLLIKNDKKQ